MNPTIDYDNLVRQLAEPHRRQPVRLALLRAFVGRLKELHAQFYAYRRDTRIIVNLTGQVAVLEGWLRYRFDEPSPSRSSPTTTDCCPSASKPRAKPCWQPSGTAPTLGRR